MAAAIAKAAYYHRGIHLLQILLKALTCLTFFALNHRNILLF